MYNLLAARPPAATENQDADTSSQAVKRRLPGDVKSKLAKVARIAVIKLLCMFLFFYSLKYLPDVLRFFFFIEAGEPRECVRRVNQSSHEHCWSSNTS